MIVFDSDKIRKEWQGDYSLLSIEDFDAYSDLLSDFLHYFEDYFQSISIECNRIRKKIRIIIRKEEYSLHDTFYKDNRNLILFENFIALLNAEYKLIRRDVLEIPQSNEDLNNDSKHGWNTVRNALNFLSEDASISRKSRCKTILYLALLENNFLLDV